MAQPLPLETAQPRALKYWHAAGSICTVAEQDGARAVVFLTAEDIENLERWYSDISLTDDALDLRRAVDERDKYVQILRHAD